MDNGVGGFSPSGAGETPQESSERYSFRELINVADLQRMVQANYDANGIPIGIIDAVTGEIYAGAGWQRICTEFHRKHPETLALCVKSDTAIASGLRRGEHTAYKCANGLWDIGIPIHCQEEHMATIFLGQFFYAEEEPDAALFAAQARKYGFPEKEYLRALFETPRLARETVDRILAYNRSLAAFLSSMATANAESRQELARKTAAEKALTRSEGMLRALLDTIPDLVWLKDENGVYVTCNETFERFFGASRQEIVGRTDYDFVEKEQADFFLEKDRQAIESDAPRVNEEWLTFAGGVYSGLFETIKTPMKDASGRLLGVLGIARDVTERKRALEVLRSRLQLSNLADESTLDEVLQSTLDEAERLTGSSIGFFHFVDEDQQHLTLQAWSSRTLTKCQAKGKGMHYPVSRAGVWADCLREGRAVIHNDYPAMENRKGYPEGHVPVIRELAVPIFQNDLAVAIMGVGNKQDAYTLDDANLVTQMANLCWEVAGRKRAESDLRQSLEEKTVLLKEIHHRVKNNLQIISSLLSLQEETIDHPQTLAALAVCRGRVASMAQVHEQIYRSQSLSGIDAREYLRQFAPRLVTAYKGGCEVSLELALEPVLLTLDQAIPFSLIVNELVTNALKHAFTGRDKGTVRLSLSRSGDEATLEVTDDGRGLPETFDQATVATLGLQIVPRLCRQLHGDISIESEQGTRFRIRFPVE